MTVNGLQIRTRALERLGALGALGKTDGVGTTAYLTDTTRLKMGTLSPSQFGDAYVRATVAATGTATGSGATSLTDSTAPFVASGLIGAVVVAATSAGAVTTGTITGNTTSVLTVTAWSNGTPSTTSAYTVDFGWVGRVLRIEPDTGRLYVSPAFPAVTGAGVAYEIWSNGLSPDDADRAKDRALTQRCSNWREQVLSVLPDIQDWRTAAYSSSLGGVTNAAAEAQTMAFPTEYFQQSMLVTNSGADGYDASPSYYVQPQDQYRVTGFVSVRAQTAAIRVRDITNGADISLESPSTFTLRGWQYFDLIFTIPTGCQEIQLWPGGASASCVAEFAGVALIPSLARTFTLPARVRSERDVGCVYVRPGVSSPSPQSANRPDLIEVAALRQRSASLVRLRLTEDVWGGIFWEERHFYAALQSGYFTVLDRVTGDTTSTDCPLEYAAAAAVCELLEGRILQDDMKAILLRATMDLQAWHEQVGPEPKTPQETTRGAPQMMRL